MSLAQMRDPYKTSTNFNIEFKSDSKLYWLYFALIVYYLLLYELLYTLTVNDCDALLALI